MNAKSGYDGLQQNIRRLKLPAIDTWDNRYSDKNYTIIIEIPELTCVCPKTGLPDFATLKIEYSPDKVCVELKSLKIYVIAYRDIGIFHEHLVNRFVEDFVGAVRPRWVRVTGEFNPRGGIKTTVIREYKVDRKYKRNNQ